MAAKNKQINIRQFDITDCGAACLASVFSYYGFHKPLSVIRFEAGTDKNGTSLLGMSDTARKNGFETLAVKVPDKSVHKDDLPAIAHLNINSKWFHFVVIYDVSDDGYRIMDPAIGKIKKISQKDFNLNWTGILLLIKPGRDFKKKSQVISAKKRIFEIIKEHKKSLAMALTGAVLYSLIGIASALYIEVLTDKIIPENSFQKLKIYSLILGLLILLRVVTGFLKSLILIRTGNQIDSNLINNYNEHLLGLPVNFFQSFNTGEIMTRINDAIKIRNFINSTVQEILVNTLIVFASLSMMIYYSLHLSLVLILSIPLYIGILKFLNTSNRKYLRKTMEISAEMESRLLETIKGVRTIKMFTAESLFKNKLRSTCRNLLSSIFRSSRDNTIASHGTDLVSGFWLLLILFSGAQEVMNFKMTYGELFSFYSLYAYISGPLIRLILSNRGIQDAKIATDRLFQIMDLEKEEVDSTKLIRKDVGINHIKVSGLSFSYPGRKELLRNVSFVCKPGTITALAGESGSGKSTLLALILKFYTPVSGAINLNHASITELSTENVRKNIAFVPQSIELFSGSLGYNISLESESWNEKKMDESIELAGMNSFISRLSGGLNTHISENGKNFSGGEKQKIALARALYKGTNLILLDEPSSSMDIESEIHLLSLLQLLKSRGKTILIAAHKLSLIRSADQILIIKNGEIAESGNHEKLIELGGIYHKFWISQHNDLKYA